MDCFLDCFSIAKIYIYIDISKFSPILRTKCKSNRAAAKIAKATPPSPPRLSAIDADVDPLRPRPSLRRLGPM